jgi:adenosylcobinamide-GDP ribazoletransferase
VRAALTAPFVALGLLTVLPAPTIAAKASTFGRSVAYFPLVGALLGAIVAAFDALGSAYLAPSIVPVLDLGLLAILTGALHLDGLADTADGLFAAGGRARRLEIMRDSATGAFAVVAVTLVLLLEAASLTALPRSIRAPALIAAGASSRWAMAIALVGFPAARTEGLAATFRAAAGPLDLLLATALVALVALPLLSASGLSLLGASAIVALAVGFSARSRLGGVTGDVCGAAGELSFAAQLALLATW